MKRGRGWSECRIAGLPEEVLIDILSRLSVKTILSCRCVSKTWHNLLSSSNTQFTKLHFNRSPIQIILQTHYISIHPVELEDDTDLDSITLFPSRCRLSSNNLYVVNSCNGFLCLVTSPSHLDTVKLCNPITGEYLNLPTLEMLDYVDVGSGFGCSANTNQYKVVMLVYKKADNPVLGHRTRAVVYTIGSKSWRTIETVPKFPDQLHSTTFFNGAIHWVCYDDLSSDYIISFDLETEKFGVVLPPSHFSIDTITMRGNIKIGVLGEFLYLCYRGELWVMKEYGVQESWTKMYVVEKRSYNLDQAIKYLSGGKILMNSSNNKLISYDPVENICKESKYPKFQGWFRTTAHVPSFMSFNDAMMGDKFAELPTKYESREETTALYLLTDNQIKFCNTT